MPEIVFLRQPTDHDIGQILALYRDAGWWTDTPDDTGLVERIVAGSHCFVAAYEKGRLIGMGRAISDRASDAYIQDVTVARTCRGRGIGSRIVEQLVNRLEADGLGWIGLIAEKNSATFYAPMGFSPMDQATPLLRKES